MFSAKEIDALKESYVRSGFQYIAPAYDSYRLVTWYKDEYDARVGIAVSEDVCDVSRMEDCALREGVGRSVVLDVATSKCMLHNIEIIPIATLSYLSDTRFSNSKSIGLRLYPNRKFAFYRLSEPQEVWTAPRRGTVLSFHPAPRGEYGFLEDDLIHVVYFFHKMDIGEELPKNESLRGMSVIFEGRVYPLPREGKKQVARRIRIG